MNSYFYLASYFKHFTSFRTSFYHFIFTTSARHTSIMIIQAASILLLVCLSLKVNNDHLNLPPRSDHGSITHYRPLCTINSCTDLVSVRMHLDKLRHSHLAPSHTKPIHSMQLVLIILCGDVLSNPGSVHPGLVEYAIEQ